MAANPHAIVNAKLRAQFVAMGGVPGDMVGAPFEGFVKAEREKWRSVIDTAQLKLE